MSGAISKPKSIFENIQGLRGIAALMVCTFHFRFVLPEPYADFFFGRGFIGVQIFFMISGFIMVYTTSAVKDHYTKNSLRFFIHRVLRIVPLYYISTFLLIADDLNDGYLVNNAGFLLKSLLFIPPFTTTIGPDYGLPVVAVGWTLNYEMIFYILFAISILTGKIRYFFLFIIFMILIILIPSFTSLGLSFDYKIWHDYSIPWLNFFTNPIWIHFVLGIVVGLVMPKIKISNLLAKISFYGSIILFAIYYTGIAGLKVNALNDLIFCGLLFIGFLINDFSVQGVRSPRILILLGNMSYSLYLFHHLSLAYFQFICYKFELHSFTESSSSFLPSLIITLIVCYLIYRFIEKPLNTKFKLLAAKLI